jgi:beta-fructofuranosidase
VHLKPIKGSAPDSAEMLSDLHLKDACGELLCIVKPNSEPFSLDLLSPAGSGDASAVATEASYLSIRYSHANSKELVVDQQRLQLGLEEGKPIELRFFIDGSVIELFVNDKATFTKRFYYEGPAAPEIAVSVTGKISDITRLSMWQLSPISKDRLTT